MKQRKQTSTQILLFQPRLEPEESTDVHATKLEGQVAAPDSRLVRSDSVDIVISGSFRKDLALLRSDFEELRDLGFRVLSPTSANVVAEKDGFVFMEGEETSSPEKIELRHLEAIRRSAFVWLHAPEGYLGMSAALEVGFARANGVPVYGRTALREASLQSLVTVVPSPNEIAPIYRQHPPPPLPAVQAFQTYYARAALRRGYEKETAEDTLLLMLEEFGELARAVRRRENLRRDSEAAISPEEQELADIFIYVVHMANVLGFDLASAVQTKEQINIKRFLTR